MISMEERSRIQDRRGTVSWLVEDSTAYHIRVFMDEAACLEPASLCSRPQAVYLL